MGKESLTKSTTKKKTAGKKKKDETQKVTAGKKTGGKKAASHPKKKRTVAAAQPKTPKLSQRDLLYKKFDVTHRPPLFTPPAPKGKPRDFTAPPFYAAVDEKDALRVRNLLFQKFSLQDLKDAAEAAAKAKAEEEARIKAEADAKAKAEEEARIKAEAAAKAKAEEEARIKAEADAKARAEEEARIKAEADAKAKAEEEARIKAEADAKKLAAERTAAREAATAVEPKVEVAYDTPIASTAAEPVDRTGRLMALGLAGGVVLLFLLVIGASMVNTGKYYLKPTPQGLEIWQGKFAPMGVHRILALPGVDGPETLVPQYDKSEVMPYAVAYFLAEADALLTQGNLPDFDAVKASLYTALDYATSRTERERINARIDGIDKAVLLYKAQITAAAQTLEGYEQAIAHYRDAARLTDDPIELEAIEAKIAQMEKASADVEARLAEETAAADVDASRAKAAAETAAGASK